ncbi:MAG: hypothetical protein ACU0B1_07435, partial [Thermohalobaculum sp.]
KGSFIKGRQHGYGVMIYASGTVFQGCWEEGRRGAEGANAGCKAQE